jgi:hypothetical protein
LFGGRSASTIDADEAAVEPRRFPPGSVRRPCVFSLVGVLAITLTLFLVVALTARLILGR